MCKTPAVLVMAAACILWQLLMMDYNLRGEKHIPVKRLWSCEEQCCTLFSTLAVNLI
jgi:hypothetical protein